MVVCPTICVQFHMWVNLISIDEGGETMGAAVMVAILVMAMVCSCLVYCFVVNCGVMWPCRFGFPMSMRI